MVLISKIANSYFCKYATIFAGIGSFISPIAYDLLKPSYVYSQEKTNKRTALEVLEIANIVKFVGSKYDNEKIVRISKAVGGPVEIFYKDNNNNHEIDSGDILEIVRGLNSVSFDIISGDIVDVSEDLKDEHSKIESLVSDTRTGLFDFIHTFK